MALHFRYYSLHKFSLTNKTSVKCSVPAPKLVVQLNDHGRRWNKMQKLQDNHDTNHRREGLVFSVTKVNTEIILSCYILITWKKKKRKKKKDFSVAEQSVHNNILCNQYQKIKINLQENQKNNTTRQNNASSNLRINCIMQHCTRC